MASSRISRARVGEPGAGEGDQLALAGGQQRAPLADFGVVAARQRLDGLVGPDRPGGRLHLGPGRLRPAEADVVGYGPGEQEPLLGEFEATFSAASGMQ